MSDNLKVLVGISAGVDSAYTLSYLKNAGYDVSAAYLIMTDDGSDITKAKKVADEAGVQFFSVDCRKEFRDFVVADFINEYKIGRTPNPCVVCNRFVKIEKLVEFALSNGFDKVATGHYADVRFENGLYSVYRSHDSKKDQSYMLWRLTQFQLSKLLLPLSKIEKSDVRVKAQELNLSSANTKDSLDICFIPDGDYAKFLTTNGISDVPGRFVSASGKFLGKSKGIINYTVGQRRGLGLAMDKSVYVTRIDAETNMVTVDYEDGIYSECFTVSNTNFIGIENADSLNQDDIFVKIRYAATPQKCSVIRHGDIYEIQSYDKPFRAVTPGQSAVFYNGDGKLLFGGYIN